MDLKEQLVSYFQFINLKLDAEVLGKCEYLCKKYDVEPEEFCDIWCAYAASTMCTDAPTVEKLEIVERKELQKLMKEKPFPKTPKSTETESRNKDRIREPISEENTKGYDKSFKNDIVVNKECSSDLPDDDFLEEFIESQLNSTQKIMKYADRPNALRIKLKVGRDEEFPIDNERNVSISLFNKEKPLTSDTKYMYEVLGQKRACLSSMAGWIGKNIAKKNNCILLNEATTKNAIGPVVTYGRILNDGKGQLNMESIMLEGTAEVNSGQCVNMNIDKVRGTALFPGQIVVVKGKMLSGEKLIAENLYTDGICDLPAKPGVIQEPLRIITAAGPFTLDEDLNYDPMRDLLNYVATKEPHVLVLLGPFLQEDHPTISKGDLNATYDDFFEELMGSISTALQDTNIQIIVIPSMRDVHCKKVYPTPPYNLQAKYSNMNFFSDPCILKIDNLLLGATTADIMYHIAKEEFVTTKNSDTLTRLATHVLQQRCFYPLYPPNHEMNMSYEFLESYGIMETLPHVLLLPSKFKGFAKNIQGCVVLNPERLTKGNGGGAFADIIITPGETSLAERLNCKILNI